MNNLERGCHSLEAAYDVALYDALFSADFKTYVDFMNELDADAVYKGLVWRGLFGDKIPPVLTSEKFLRYRFKSQGRKK